jgi:hypothetical protein
MVKTPAETQLLQRQTPNIVAGSFLAGKEKPRGGHPAGPKFSPESNSRDFCVCCRSREKPPNTALQGHLCGKKKPPACPLAAPVVRAKETERGGGRGRG